MFLLTNLFAQLMFFGLRVSLSEFPVIDDFFVPAEQVGEGAFGEVFLLAIDSAPVLKIVAVDGSAPVNGQPQTKLSDMLAEIIITSELSKLRNTTKYCRAENFVEVLLSYVFFCSQSWRSWVLSKHVKL